MIDNQSSDEVLVRKLQQSSSKRVQQQVIDLLFSRYSNKMLEYFYYSLNKDKEKSRDFVQDLFLKLLEKPELFDTNRKFKPWLYSVAANMCKNEFRKIGTENKYNEFVSNELKLVDDKPAAEKFIINEALSHLKQEHKIHLILRYKFKMSIREMSEVLQCPEGTVRSRLFYVTKELSKYLKR
ncbi:MAG: hypothetical protein COA97_04625 [Flavobacteriales bacterium]|nr:MAG: hypothetical protein COA97_04625 [Flavobacteriales bacterium]